MQVFAHRKHHAAACVLLVPGRFDEAVKEPWLFGRELFFSLFFFSLVYVAATTLFFFPVEPLLISLKEKQDSEPPASQT